jgi:DNA-binding transcriptional ArsR family regulator
MAIPLLEDDPGTIVANHASKVTHIAASIPVEIFWVAHGLRTGHLYRDIPVLVNPPDGFVHRLNELWGPGGPSSFGEALVIADQLGVLFTESVDEFAAALRQGAAVDPQLRLRSETEEDRRAVLERCARLAANTGFRRRYAALAAEVWSLVAETWEQAGRREVHTMVDRLRRDAGRTTDLEALLGSHHLHEPWLAQATDAFAAGGLSIAVSYFGGRFLAWDLAHTYLIGVQAAPQDDRTRLRRESQRLASRLKVLSDPTRLAILISLSRSAATVTELAQAFGLAQPTVSAHLKLLREAQLVDGGREAGRPAYTADRRAVSLLLKEVEHQFEDRHLRMGAHSSHSVTNRGLE